MSMPLPFTMAMIILLLMTQESLATRSSYLRTCESLFQRSQHHALTGHSFLNQSGTVRLQCVTLCVRQCLCSSFNHNNISGMCQLNNARKEEYPANYKQDDGFSYFDRLAYGSVETTTDAKQRMGCQTHSAKTHASFCSVQSQGPSCGENEGSEWQLVFKGVAGTGIELYGLWTNTVWDGNLGGHGNYRNETLYNAWKIGELNNICRVKLSLYDHTGVKVELVFNGTGSDILSWFAKERLVSSPWSDLTTTASTNRFSITGDTMVGLYDRRFYINMNYAGCSKDRGWLMVVESAIGVCDWEKSFSSNPVILYSTNNTVTYWNNARNDETMGRADYLTVHVDTN